MDELTDAVPKSLGRSLGGFSQASFQLAEGILDRIEVGRVFRQKDEARAAVFDDALDLL